MIAYDPERNLFSLTSKNTTYRMALTETGHLEHLYYGPIIEPFIDLEVVRQRYQFEHGSATSYDQDHKGLMMHQLLLEVPTYGKGDYREPLLHVELPDGSRTIDLKYHSHEIIAELAHPGLPQCRKSETLAIRLLDDATKVAVIAYYSIVGDVVVRNIAISNQSEHPIILDRALSANLDLPQGRYLLTKLDGAWIRERHQHDVPLTYGTIRFDSKKGVSSADHNPFFVIRETSSGNDHGLCVGMALVYSGNFEANIETQSHDLLRCNIGINSFDFRYPLAPGETFYTPEVILSVSDQGLNGLSQQFHHAINEYLIPTKHKQDRPIIINNWEATYFDFNEKKLLAIAKQAHKLGIELFCLDDGWFHERNDDYRSLGDWHVNPRKLRHGLRTFGEKLNRIGLKFGLWVEPEMVNEDSDLFRAHPDWAIGIPGRTASLGRNQRMLDLANPDVQIHLKETLVTLFEDAGVAYVKWDMNRNISDVFSTHLSPAEQGAYHHRYVMGLYDILAHVTSALPDVLFEGCASGGNRFDLGMLYYMPQTWTSDDTDALERMRIQEGTSLLYPLSSISNHVSGDRSHQVFRHTPIESRFNVAAFGVLGYELDVTELTPFEQKAVKAQIAYYKEFRSLLQYGTFSCLRSINEANEAVWMVTNEERTEALVLYFQTLARPNPPIDKIRIPGLSRGTYHIEHRKQFINIRTFGSLVNEALPIKLHVNSTLHNFVANRYMYESETFQTTMTASQLAHVGLQLPHRFTGTGHNDKDMILEDFGSRLYHLKKIQA